MTSSLSRVPVEREDCKVIYYMCISKEMKDDTREARNETVRRELIKDWEREREREREREE